MRRFGRFIKDVGRKDCVLRKIDGRQLDFSTPADQILAYMWFIGQVRTAWEKLAPKNLQLAGFYILSEILVAKPSGYNYAKNGTRSFLRYPAISME